MGTCIKGVIAAAGLSRRMGAFKPPMPINGRPMIERSVMSMLSADVEEVVVVLGYRAREIEEVLRQSPAAPYIRMVRNRDYLHSEMLDSIKLGVASLGPCSDFFLLPGDIPMVSPATFRAIQKTHLCGENLVTFPTVDGRRKHPPLISARCIQRILSFQEAGGLRQLWKNMEQETGNVAVDDMGCTMDVDSPGDYEKILQYLARSVRGSAV